MYKLKSSSSAVPLLLLFKHQFLGHLKKGEKSGEEP
uniref:Uncharacterized protein n=1 Tax=Anguilla anguilla TaxID=7936 RepID=A0A0E9VI60_ANGAN